MNRYASTNIASATTTVVKASPGELNRVIINKGVVSGVITIYDNATAGSGTKIATITFGAALLSDPPYVAEYGAWCSKGITVVTSAATDITVVYA